MMLKLKSSPAVKSAHDVSVKNCLQKPSTASLNYEDAKLVTHFVRRKLNTSSHKLSGAKQEDNLGYEKKIRKVRKQSKNASSPFKEKRTRQLDQIRRDISGDDNTSQQAQL